MLLERKYSVSQETQKISDWRQSGELIGLWNVLTEQKQLGQKKKSMPVTWVDLRVCHNYL